MVRKCQTVISSSARITLIPCTHLPKPHPFETVPLLHLPYWWANLSRTHRPGGASVSFFGTQEVAMTTYPTHCLAVTTGKRGIHPNYCKTVCMHLTNQPRSSLVPRPSHRPIFDCLQYMYAKRRGSTSWSILSCEWHRVYLGRQERA